MPKVTKYPRLRSHVRKNKAGKVRVYYFYDMRPDGGKDITLGPDYAEALQKWEELYNHKPRIKGRIAEATERWRERVLQGYPNEETRTGYAKQLANIEAVFGLMVWDEVTLPMLREYLDRRMVKQKKGDKSPPKPAKTQGNREMSVFSIVWGKARLWGMTSKPWPAAGVKNWKNEESERTFEVTDALFGAVYKEAEPMLRDCMDIATATGMRLKDCRTILLPAGDWMRLKASKTGKSADFDLRMSQVLPDLILRRRNIPAAHLMLLSTPEGFNVSARMLRTAWEKARTAAFENPANRTIEMALKAMYLRDMRKRASDLALDDEQASKLLQHGGSNITKKHYRTKVTQLKPVR